MRSVLIVLECDTLVHRATATVRAFQYKKCFAESERIRADFVSRRSPGLVAWQDRLRLRWHTRLLSRFLSRLEFATIRKRELRILQCAKKYDFVYLIRVPSFDLHSALYEGPAKVIMDVNDALWLPFFRSDGYAEFDTMLTLSAGVICENGYLANYASQHNSKVRVVPDAPQVEAFDEQRDSLSRRQGTLNIGWIGSPGTADTLCAIFEPLEEIFGQHKDIHLRVLGASASHLPRFEKVRFTCKPKYTNEEMIREALQMDVGLFPMFRTEDAAARGTLKARIYMGAEAAVIGRRWGELPSLIQHGVNGYLAEDQDDWNEGLKWMIDNPKQRRLLSDRALNLIRTKYSRQACFEQLVEALESF